jgi:hypothetical protein
MLDLSIWRDEVLIRHQGPQFCNNKLARPKNSRKLRYSIPMEPIGRPALFWMSFPTISMKSLATGVDILVRFVLLSSMLRIGAMLRVGGVERG